MVAVLQKGTWGAGGLQATQAADSWGHKHTHRDPDTYTPRATQIHSNTATSTHTHTLKNPGMETHTNTHTNPDPHTPRDLNTHTHTPMGIHTETEIFTDIPRKPETQRHIHTYTHIHMHPQNFLETQICVFLHIDTCRHTERKQKHSHRDTEKRNARTWRHT